jgi:prepilin-type N-terminal cleavage/methylation domain-containing protein
VKRFRLSKAHGETAVTLIELLCVIAIIAILAGLLLPAVSRAYLRVKGMAELMEEPEVASMLCEESRNYCRANAQYQFRDKSDFRDKCHLAPKCQAWMASSTTEFVPFTFADPTNKVVLSVHLGPRHETLYTFTKFDLSVTPPGR